MVGIVSNDSFNRLLCLWLAVRTTANVIARKRCNRSNLDFDLSPFVFPPRMWERFGHTYIPLDPPSKGDLEFEDSEGLEVGRGGQVEVGRFVGLKVFESRRHDRHEGEKRN